MKLKDWQKIRDEDESYNIQPIEVLHPMPRIPPRNDTLRIVCMTINYICYGILIWVYLIK